MKKVPILCRTGEYCECFFVHCYYLSESTDVGKISRRKAQGHRKYTMFATANILCILKVTFSKGVSEPEPPSGTGSLL